MNKYESIIIVNDAISEEIRKEVVSKITTFLNEVGNVTKVEELGKKKLAYEIKNHSYGYYIVFYFETDSKNIQELERLYQITEEVMKFIVVKVED